MGPAYRTFLDVALVTALLVGAMGGDSAGRSPPAQMTCGRCSGGCIMRDSGECLTPVQEEVRTIMSDAGSSFEQFCSGFSGQLCPGEVDPSSSACNGCDGCLANGVCMTLADPDFSKLMELVDARASEVCASEQGIWCGSEDPASGLPTPAPVSEDVVPCSDCRGCHFNSGECSMSSQHEDGQSPEDACQAEQGTWCGESSVSDGDTELVSDDDDDDEVAPEECTGCHCCQDGCFFQSNNFCRPSEELEAMTPDVCVGRCRSPAKVCQNIGGAFCGAIPSDDDASGSEDACSTCRGGCVLPQDEFCVMPGDPDVEDHFGEEAELTPEICQAAGGSFCAVN